MRDFGLDFVLIAFFITATITCAVLVAQLLLGAI
jgi:hypothetical protein